MTAPQPSDVKQQERETRATGDYAAIRAAEAGGRVTGLD